MTDDFIRKGDELIIPDGPEEGIWLVKPGDSLSLISFETDVSVEDIKALNGLEDEKILVGQEIRLPPLVSDGRSYEVLQGDSLWKIARKYDTTPETLSRLNNLDSSRITPGMNLRLPLFSSVTKGINVLKAMLSGPAAPEPGPWFNFGSEKRTQPSLEYGELSPSSTVENYAMALDVKAKLDKEIDRAGKLSRDLKGWTVVIDPGHGGLDPGAVVQTTDGNGYSSYVIEDEYAYDIAIRVYALLKQHGADADMTIISPNHHVRHTPDASLTFVNEKNEVYNSPTINQTGAWGEWPAGGRPGLEKRVDTAREIIEKEGNGKSLFVSIHCDNTPGGFKQSGVLFWGSGEEEKDRSRTLAQAFESSFPAGLDIKEQQLYVLTDNPASEGAVLVEIRNVHYDSNSWALRNGDLRDQDAQKIVNSLLHYVSTY